MIKKDDYNEIAKNRGFKLLGMTAPNTSTKVIWECSEGHRWQAPTGRVKSGSGCRECAKEKSRKKPVDYLTLAEKRGFKWLDEYSQSVAAKTGWQCGKGHKWEASFNSVNNNGSGCPVCSGRVACSSGKRQPQDYHTLAAKRGFKWLGPEVPNVTTKTKWQCEKGHEWESRYKEILRGGGCRTCRDTSKRKQPADYHALAQERGFKWLGPEVSNTSTGTGWQCPKGHEWQARYSTIKQAHGCPHPQCATRSKQPQDYHALAAKRGYKWLGPEVLSVNTKTAWQCEKGHEWESRYSNILRGNGCHICACNSRKQPADYHALAEKRGFTWLGGSIVNVSTETKWQCEKGHTWEQTYDKIKRGRLCPECRLLKRNPKRVAVTNPKQRAKPALRPVPKQKAVDTSRLHAAMPGAGARYRTRQKELGKIGLTVNQVWREELKYLTT